MGLVLRGNIEWGKAKEGSGIVFETKEGTFSILSLVIVVDQNFLRHNFLPKLFLFCTTHLKTMVLVLHLKKNLKMVLSKLFQLDRTTSTKGMVGTLSTPYAGCMKLNEGETAVVAPSLVSSTSLKLNC